MSTAMASDRQRAYASGLTPSDLLFPSQMLTSRSLPPSAPRPRPLFDSPPGFKVDPMCAEITRLDQSQWRFYGIKFYAMSQPMVRREKNEVS
jgi:hypothetical protein